MKIIGHSSEFFKLGQTERIPKILYHATYVPLLRSIMTYGLGGKTKRRNWEDSVKGTSYLAEDKDVAESYAETSDMVPESWLDKIIVLKVKTDKLDIRLFGKDKNNLSGDTFEYRGVIPPTEIEVMNYPPAEDVFG